MSLRIVESFDSFTTNATIRRKYPYTHVSGPSTGAGGRFPDGLRYFDGAAIGLMVQLDAQSTWYVHVAIWLLNISNGTDILFFYDGGLPNGLGGIGEPQISLQIGSQGSITVRRGSNNGTIIGQSSIGVVRAQIWHSLQFGFTIHNSTGQIQVLVDNAEVINETNIDTQDTANATADFFRLDMNTANNPSRADDLVVCDGAGTLNNALLGDILVEYLRPSADGAVTQFTPVIGQNWENVDDLQSDDDGTYNSTVDDADQDLYVKPALLRIDPTGGVIGLSVNSTVRRDDTGGINTKNIVRSGGVIYEQANNVCSTDYLTFEDILELDPDGNIQWTEAKVNAMQFGVKAIIP